jgi:hypothetical protein
MIAKMLTKKFQGSTPKEAEAAAVKWSNDLTAHEAVKVESVETMKKGHKFIATIAYQE